MTNHAWSTCGFSQRTICDHAMVAPMVYFRATLTHKASAVSWRLDRRARTTDASMVANRSSRHRRTCVLAMAIAAGCGPLPGFPTVSTGDGTGEQDGSTGPAASTGPGASGHVDSTATNDSACEPSVSCECESAALGSHDWWYGECCDEPFGTCDEWCIAHGYGPCVLGFAQHGDVCDDAVACDQCGVGETCHCSTDFGPGQCLPDAWDQCAPPCDTTCLYYEGEWVCALPGC